LYKESASIILDNVGSSERHIKWYEKSRHINTLGEEKEKINHDVLTFLNWIDWKE